LTFFLQTRFFELKLQKNCIFQQTASSYAAEIFTAQIRTRNHDSPSRLQPYVAYFTVEAVYSTTCTSESLASEWPGYRC
jgi:hypothetical protein